MDEHLVAASARNGDVTRGAHPIAYDNHYHYLKDGGSEICTHGTLEYTLPLSTKSTPSTRVLEVGISLLYAHHFEHDQPSDHTFDYPAGIPAQSSKYMDIVE